MEEDDPLRLWRKVRHTDQSACLRVPLVEPCRECAQIGPEERREGADPDTLRRAPEELPARQVQIDFVFAAHCYYRRWVRIIQCARRLRASRGPQALLL